MSRVSPFRLLATAGLAVGTAGVGLATAPAALAVPEPAVSLSASTLEPGEEFTVSGTGCLPVEDEDVVVVVMPAVDPQWGDAVEPADDGSWSFLLQAPAEEGTYAYDLLCDQYDVQFEYPDVTITVVADPATTPPAPTRPTGTVRGSSANTPGVASPDTGAATGDRSAPGQRVVKILTGFQPHEVVTVTLHSTPTRLGTFTADASGTVRIEFTVPAGTPAGDHTLVYEGDRGTYFQESFTVAAAASATGTDGELAYTGAGVALPLGLGAGALALGGGLVVLTRRRSAGAVQG